MHFQLVMIDDDDHTTAARVLTRIDLQYFIGLFYSLPRGPEKSEVSIYADIGASSSAAMTADCRPIRYDKA